jgi:hypothetical protein
MKVSKNVGRHDKPFNVDEFIHQVWLTCAPKLSENFQNNKKICNVSKLYHAVETH